eukprot:s466_g20.t1
MVQHVLLGDTIFNLGAFWQLLYNAVRYEQEARILGVSIPTNQGPPKKNNDGVCISIVALLPLSPHFNLPIPQHCQLFQRASGASWTWREYDTWITWILKLERPMKKLENNMP